MMAISNNFTTSKIEYYLHVFQLLYVMWSNLFLVFSLPLIAQPNPQKDWFLP